MKLIAIFLLVACLQVSARTEGQGITLSAKNKPLEKVLTEIKKQSGFSFIYGKGLISKASPVSVNVKDEPLEKVLELIFENQQLTYKISESYVVISLKSIASPTSGSSRQINIHETFPIIIKGRVVDEQGNPLSSASVKLKGSSKGTATNDDGDFSLEIPDAGGLLVISYIGYETVEVSVSKSEEMKVVLKKSDTKAQEIVVVGYGTQKKENLTGAISTIDAKKLDSRPLTNIGQGLQGLIPNLNINIANGRPGTGATFNVRGYTSINGGGPIILVDGVQMDPNQINPDDVESVTVLKDAAAAAIYGGRAAFGVVLMTTKKGKKNTPTSVTYGYDYTLTKSTRLPKMINSLDYITMYMDAKATGAATNGPTGKYHFTDLNIQKVKEYLANPTPLNSVYFDPAYPGQYSFSGNTDWVEALFDGWAPQQQHTVSLSGGSERTTYRASFGAFDQKGVLTAANNVYKRYNLNLAVNSTVTSWFDVNFKMAINRAQNDRPANTPLFDISPERFVDDQLPVWPIQTPNGYYTYLSFNPFAAIASGGRYKFTSTDVWVTGGFTMRPLKHVTITGDYTWNPYYFNDKNNTVPYGNYGPPANAADFADPSKAPYLGYYGLSTPASVRESNTHDTYLAGNIYAQYENSFANKHYLKVMVGYNQEEKKFESFNAYAKDLVNPDYPYLSLNNDPRPVVGSSIGDWALIGTLFRANYIYDQRYLLEIAGRYDGTSRFQEDNRYAFSPSASAGWRISNENFFTPLRSIVDNLMIRVSYGQLPNQLLSSNYPYIATLPYGNTGYVFRTAQQPYVSSPGLVSANFTWEKVSTRNIGVEFGFLGNRLTGSFDYYIRNTKDMVVAGTALPAVLGTGAPSQNAADLQTKGFELELNWSDRFSNGLSYSVGFTLSDNTTKITKYGLNPTGNINDFYEGKQLGEIWGYQTVGLYQTDAAAAAVDNSQIWGGKWLAGDVQYADLNKDGKISGGNFTLANPGDQRRIGNNLPRYMFGITANVEYKGFDFSMFAQGIAERDVMLGGPYFWGLGYSEYSVPSTEQLDYWTPANPNAYFPRPRLYGGGNVRAQTRYLQNGAYLRMKQLTLGYSFPTLMLKKIKLNKLRLYVTGQNLFVITNLFKTFDPEQPDQAGKSYPLNKAISFGAQIQL